MLEPTSNRRIFTVNKSIGMACAGLLPDCRQISNRAQSEVKDYISFYNADIPIRVLNDRLSAFYQLYTLYSSVRPFGCSVIFGGVDDEGPQLYKIDPSGISYGYKGCAAGKAQRNAKNEIEKLKFDTLTCKQAIFEAARIIFAVNDEEKDKDFLLELSWVSPESDFKHQFVPQELYDEAVTKAKASKLEESSED